MATWIDNVGLWNRTRTHPANECDSKLAVTTVEIPIKRPDRDDIVWEKRATIKVLALARLVTSLAVPVLAQ
jgi:hypothetical protein